MLLFSNKVLADYTVESGTTVDANTLTGQSGVLTINGKLVVSGNTTLSGFTSVIITAPNGTIFWNDGNYDLIFPNVNVFNINTGAPGLQPTAGQGNASTRLIVGLAVIAVSSDNANNAPYSFEQFNLSGGLPIFALSASPANEVCYGTTVRVNLTPLNNKDRRFKCDWTVSNSGVVSPTSNIDFTTPQVVTLAPSAANATSTQTYIITCNIYTYPGNEFITTKTITITIFNGFLWTGNGLDNLWNNSANWTACGVPPNDASVTIPELLSKNYPKLNVNFRSNNFDLKGTSSIELNGQTLTLGISNASVLNLNGTIIGSKTSNLVIQGGSTTLKFDQTTNPGQSNALLNFTVNSSGQTITLGTPLLVVGDVKPSAGIIASGTGNLTLVSTATTSSNITAISATSDVSGDVNVQAYITGGGTGLVNRGFRSMSSPINDSQIIGTGSKRTFRQMKDFIPITGPGGVTNGFDQGGAAQPYAETITLYDETKPAFTAASPSIATIDQAQVRGTGFLAFFRGSQGNSYTNNYTKLNAPFVTPDQVTITFKGPINKNSISVPLTYTYDANDKYNGYNLVGNPYPSAINWTAVTKTANVIDSYIIVLPGGKQASYLDGTGNNLSTNITDLASTIIQPCQGFYVRASSTGASLTFTESSKSTNYPNRMLTVPQNVIMSAVPLAFNQRDKISSAARVIRLNLLDGINNDETTLVFKEGGSLLAGFEDALYFSGGAVTLGSLSSDGRTMAINGLPDISEVKEVRLNVNATSSKIVKLNFQLAQTKGYEVFLKDSLLPGKLIDIKKNPVYEFSIDKKKYETYGNERFTMVFKKEEIFPLALKFFTAKKQSEGVKLNWTLVATGVAEEYQIEQSVDGKDFNIIGSVRSQGNAQGNETYYFTDKQPIEGMNYYRIRQIHLNGRVSLSEIRSVDNSSAIGIGKMTVYPNPVIDEIEVKMMEHINEPIEFRIYDMHGKKVMTRNFLETEAWRYDLSNLAPSIYILEIRSFNSKKLVGRSKFVKQSL